MSKLLSRRSFLRTAAVVTGTTMMRPKSMSATSFSISIGANTTCFRDILNTAENILEYMQILGLTKVELEGTVAEQYAGAPPPGLPPRHPQSMTMEERNIYVNSRVKSFAELQKWRRSAPIVKFIELGEMFRDGGVEIDILKLGSPNWFEEDINYAYRVAKAIGARGITFDISPISAKRMAPFASKYNLFNSLKHHMQVAKDDFSFDEHLAYSPRNMLNLDIGDYVAALGASPIPVIEQYADRITHINLKDCTGPENGQESVPWGSGETPIIEVLQLLRDREYPIPAMIELEYSIPEDSSVMEEMKKCVEYCRTALG